MAITDWLPGFGRTLSGEAEFRQFADECDEAANEADQGGDYEAAQELRKEGWYLLDYLKRTAGLGDK